MEHLRRSGVENRFPPHLSRPAAPKQKSAFITKEPKYTELAKPRNLIKDFAISKKFTHAQSITI